MVDGTYLCVFPIHHLDWEVADDPLSQEILLVGYTHGYVYRWHVTQMVEVWHLVVEEDVWTHNFEHTVLRYATEEEGFGNLHAPTF